LTNGDVYVDLLIELRGYIDERGHKRFAVWMDRLNPVAAAKVTMALARMEAGNLANAKSVGSGVFEYRINFGLGYRILFQQVQRHPHHL
jgi:putative addiction module killer protein